MAKLGACTPNSDTSPAELKLRRIVRLLARTEARAWLAGRAADDTAPAAGTSATGTVNTHPTKEATHAD